MRDDDVGRLALTLNQGNGFSLKVPGKGTAAFVLTQALSLWAQLEYEVGWAEGIETVWLPIDTPWQFSPNGTDEVYLTVTFIRQDGIRAKLRLEAPRSYEIERTG